MKGGGGGGGWGVGFGVQIKKNIMGILFRVYLSLRTCKISLCFGAIVYLLYIVSRYFVVLFVFILQL